MGEAKRRTVHAAVHGVTNAAADAGAIMAIGFAAFVATAKPPIPDDDLRRWRDAYFAGAQHLWASVFDVLDPDKEPTERDLRRMDLLHHELTAWRDDINARMGNPLDEAVRKPDA
mgnify:CR=1 FL=1